VLDAFDEWRRAVGMGAVTVPEGNEAGGSGLQGTAEAGGTTGPSGVRRPRLASHLDRVRAWLTSRRTRGDVFPALDAAIEWAVRELDVLRGGAAGARGEARRDILERLADIDRALLDAARGDSTPATLERLQQEVEAQLAPFRERMSDGAWRHAREAALTRLLREEANLPVVALD
jgi:hypothetical protein